MIKVSGSIWISNMGLLILKVHSVSVFAPPPKKKRLLLVLKSLTFIDFLFAVVLTLMIKL